MSSLCFDNSEQYKPKNVALFGVREKYFHSSEQQSNWIKFDFKKNKVIPTYYTIKSVYWTPNDQHPRSWTIEGSNNNFAWEKIDEQKDCPLLNGQNRVHTFKIDGDNSKEFKYIRMRTTGPDWRDLNYLAIDSFEINGTLI